MLTDHGPGIPEADRKHAVERFVRLELSRSLPGSGLGLSLASAVATLARRRTQAGRRLSRPDRNIGYSGRSALGDRIAMQTQDVTQKVA